MSPVYCHDCDWVAPSSRNEAKPWRYRCMKAPTRAGYAFVHPKYSPDPPYQLCEKTNFDGRCSMFEPRRLAPEEVVNAPSA